MQIRTSIIKKEKHYIFNIKRVQREIPKQKHLLEMFII